MFVIRPITIEDSDAIYELTAYAKAGLTTLPHDRELLNSRIESSLNSFMVKPQKPQGDTYLFVLEDDETQEIVGICGIVSKVGGFEPFYTYEIKTTVKKSMLLNVEKEVQYLQLQRIHNGPTEIGSLFLKPTVRQKGVGRLLSLCRFLFIAQYPQSFETDVIAELRGVFDAQEHSPFWDAIGTHFFDVEFKKADLMGMKDKSFIEELIPQHPIYIPLLPREVQDVIGKVAKDTEPARHLLMQEGFSQMDAVDIFEAGPVLKAPTKEIRSVKNSILATISSIEEQDIDSTEYVIANVTSMDSFKVCLGQLSINPDVTVGCSPETAKAIGVQKGDKIRFVALRAKG